MSDPNKITELISKFSLDPLGYVDVAFPWGHGALAEFDGPRKWQGDVLKTIGSHLQDPLTRYTPLHISVASGHGIGKSALIAMIAAWGFDTMIDTRIVITANTEQQLVTKTSPEVAKWRKLAVTSDWAKVATMKHSANFPGHEDSWRLDFVTWSENNTEAFAGLHNLGKRIIVIYDEAAGIVDKVWEVTEGALTDANTQIIWIAFGNPTKNTGRFRETFARHRHKWKTRQIDSRTVEGTNTEYLQGIVDTYGLDSDIAKVRVLGQFPSASSMQFIGTALVEAAMDRECLHGAILPSDPVIFGLDHARFGDDSTVLAIRQGRDARTRPWQRWVGANSMEIAGDVNAAIRQYKPDAVFIDAGGQNAGGVIDRLRQLNPQDEHGAVPIFEINFGSRQKGMTARGASDQRVKVANKRAQMYQNLKRWLDRGILPEWDNQADSIAQRIRDDLVGSEYSYDADSAILLEKKEHMKARGLPSPDYGDALALTFAEDVAPREIPEYLNPDNYGTRTMVEDREDELAAMRGGRADYDRYDELR